MAIFVKVGDVVREIEIVESKTSKVIVENLPIEGVVRRWGDEIYFETRIDFEEEENPKDVVEIGDVAFWIPGKAVCIFFGKTPISDDKIRPASPVNVFGKIKGDTEDFKKISEGERILIYSD